MDRCRRLIESGDWQRNAIEIPSGDCPGRVICRSEQCLTHGLNGNGMKFPLLHSVPVESVKPEWSSVQNGFLTNSIITELKPGIKRFIL